MEPSPVPQAGQVNMKDITMAGLETIPAIGIYTNKVSLLSVFTSDNILYINEKDIKKKITVKD